MEPITCAHCGQVRWFRPSVARVRVYCDNHCRTEGTKIPAHERLEGKYEIDPDTGCWDWTGKINAYGYGRLSLSRSAPGETLKEAFAHRVSYEKHVGEIPEGLDLDHLCRNRRCVNPDHLEPVTRKENLRRGHGEHSGGKTHCKRGHEFTPENTIITTEGYRNCRECGRVWQRAYNARKRAGLL